MSKRKQKTNEKAPKTPPEDTDASETSEPVSAEEERTEAPEEDPCAALTDRLLRLQADFDNYRKRTIRERENQRLRSIEDLILELLPILDHLELGLQTAKEHKVTPSVIHGFQLVLDQALGVLGKFGLEPIDAVDQPFDPNCHESVAVAPSETVPRDAVLSQIRRGYRLGTQLLRPAQVVLSLGSADEKTKKAPKTKPGKTDSSGCANRAE